MGESGLQARGWVELPTSGLGYAVACVASTAASIDLSTIDYLGSPNTIQGGTTGRGATGCYVSIISDGVVPIYILGYPSAAAFAANPPVIGVTGNVNGPKNPWPIYPTPATGPSRSGDCDRFLVRYGFNHVLGFISAGTPTLRIYRSSPSSAGAGP